MGRGRKYFDPSILSEYKWPIAFQGISVLDDLFPGARSDSLSNYGCHDIDSVISVPAQGNL
jgi:hypothetical protein